MRLKRPGLFRALVGATPTHVMSSRRLALAIGTPTSYVADLMSGHRTDCAPGDASAICKALGVPISHLFEAV